MAAGGFVDVSVLGFPEVDRMLKILPAKLQKKIVSKALRKGAKVVKEAAAAKARGFHNPGTPGDLMLKVARGLKVRVWKRRRKLGFFGMVVQTPTRAQLGLAENSKWYPPAHVELGTEKTPALSYLRAAKKEKEGEVKRSVARAIKRELVAEARKAVGHPTRRSA